MDSATGVVIDRSHPDLGAVLAGQTLVMPGGRGTEPCGIILQQADSILAVGALVARELYGVVCPIVVSASLP